MQTLRTKNSRFYLCIVMALAMAHSLHGPADATAQDAGASPTRNDLLKDFVDNCVLIEPGTEKFPQQFQLGRHFESPFAFPNARSP